MKPVYFDLTVTDLAAARAFFGQVLGWRFERFPAPGEYYRIAAGLPDEPGIDGGIGRAADAPLSGGRPLTVLTLPVADLDAAVARVLGAGGSVPEPPTRIPGIGRYATCAEPGGLMFGLLETDPPVA
ncbi:VOC family protein [Albidovulum sp.]|jgi:predicted enzyme related to lactoylglutathione lyase|uniref:VOC family protein n=1 Tax=Albidovulum sp. TaxID=1872424 RepID=UPI003053C9E3